MHAAKVSVLHHQAKTVDVVNHLCKHVKTIDIVKQFLYKILSGLLLKKLKNFYSQLH